MKNSQKSCSKAMERRKKCKVFIINTLGLSQIFLVPRLWNGLSKVLFIDYQVLTLTNLVKKKFLFHIFAFFLKVAEMKKFISSKKPIFHLY